MDRTQVLALAPDEASLLAAQRVRSWLETGTADGLVWGECPGSGQTPYRAIADLAGPAYTCSCPSRKVPCKHVLALLIKHADGDVPVAGQPPDWASGWRAGLAARRARAGRTDSTDSAGSAGAQQPADAEAAHRRAAQREARVAAGLEELDQWLTDQVRSGLAGAATAGYAHWEAIAARMVDAQCPAIAERLRGLAGASHSGPGWESRLLEELALLWLLATAYRGRARLDEDLAGTVRSRIGFTIRQADVIAAEAPVSDVWDVLGWRDTEQERIRSRRIWLRGSNTGRPALVLSFAAAGEQLDASFVPGTSVPAALAFYPGAVPLRAAVVSRETAVPAIEPAGGSIADALRDWATALGRDPWLESLPVVLGNVIPAAEGESGNAAVTLLMDADGDALPVHQAAGGCWPLVALSGGHPVTVAAECTPRGLWPMTAWPRGAAPVPVLLLSWPDCGTSGTSCWPRPSWERSDAPRPTRGCCSTAPRRSPPRAEPAASRTTPLPRHRQGPTTARPSAPPRRGGSPGCCAGPART